MRPPVVRALVAAGLAITAVALAGMRQPAQAAPPTQVCFTPAFLATPRAGPSQLAAGRPGVIVSLTPPGPVGGIAASGAQTFSLPSIVLMTPQPGTGAFVVPVTTTLPSAPGASLVAPQVVVPPAPAPGQDPALVAAQLLRSLLGPSGVQGSPAPLQVSCY